jgi:serine/threonine-protein kinase
MTDGRARIKVVDFGLVKDLSLGSVKGSAKGLTGENVMLGSPYYMPPEQIRTPNLADARSDIWALAATLFRLLTGQPPFVAANTHGVLGKILNEAAPRARTLRPDIPAQVDAAIARALARDPKDRFARVESFIDALGSGSDLVSLAPDSDHEVTIPVELPAKPTVPLAPTLDETRTRTPDTEPEPRRPVPPTALSPGMGPKVTAPFMAAQPARSVDPPPPPGITTSAAETEQRSFVGRAVLVAVVLAAICSAVLWARRVVVLPTRDDPRPGVVAIEPPPQAAVTPPPTEAPPPAPKVLPSRASAEVPPGPAKPEAPKPHPPAQHKPIAVTAPPTPKPVPPAPPASTPAPPPGGCAPNDPYCYGSR